MALELPLPCSYQPANEPYSENHFIIILPSMCKSPEESLPI